METREGKACAWFQAIATPQGLNTHLFPISWWLDPLRGNASSTLFVRFRLHKRRGPTAGSMRVVTPQEPNRK
eukprot:scaffold158758_cov21-Tisochrysis_lutea.AAC.1